MSRLVRISEAASLALHTMALMAQESEHQFANHEIAERLGASKHHLAKVMQRLTKGGLVGSMRGPGGGFHLLRPADEITLLEIYESMEGPLVQEGCLLTPNLCPPDRICLLGDLFRQVNHLIGERLASIRLADLAGNAAFPCYLTSLLDNPPGPALPAKRADERHPGRNTNKR